MVKKLIQTVCLAYYTTIMQKTKQIIFEYITIRKNQKLHWIWKKVNQFKAVEMVKSLTQTECLAYYTSIMQKQNKQFLNVWPFARTKYYIGCEKSHSI